MNLVLSTVEQPRSEGPHLLLVGAASQLPIDTIRADRVHRFPSYSLSERN